MAAASDPPENQDEVPPPAPGIEASSAVAGQPTVEAPVRDESPPPAESLVTGAEQERPAATASDRSEPARSSVSAAPSDAPVAPRSVEKQSRAEPKPAGGAVTATDTNPSALIALLVALIALGFFVFRALN